jgi:TRAP-type C4-dicarboxylate transport system substrate-binding protein
MFIEAVPNLSLPSAGRLRESYRDQQGRSQKRTLANLSNMYSGWRPIRTPSDIAGLKMGSQATKIARYTVLAFGGIPTVIAINALYTSLQTNLIDGASSSLPDMIDL